MQTHQFDRALALTFIVLMAFGLVMISSVSVYQSYQLTAAMTKKGLMEAPVNDFYLWRDLVNVLIAIPVMLGVSFLPFRAWHKFAAPLFGVSFLLLILLFLPGFGNDYGTSRSWLNLGILPSIQPVEIAKLGLILYLAIWMEKKTQAVESFEQGFLPFVVLLIPLVALLAAQPDFGSILTISAISAAMYYIAGGGVRYIFAGGALAALVVWPIILSKEYIRNRFLAFIDPSIDPMGIGFQIKQALISIGSGQWFGIGFGQSVQKFGYLPEVQSDMIFAAASEELGFVRITIMLGAFAFIAYRGFRIAANAPDRFSMLVAAGISSWFLFQTFINIGVAMSILPLTGITLPFVSYGGSSLIMNAIAAGILLNISRFTGIYSMNTTRRSAGSGFGRRLTGRWQ